MTDVLRFKSLRCENFMPYLDEVVTFPDNKNGVLIINGQNGHGKSSILNAIRFVLFGEIDSSDEIDFIKYVNRDGFSQGKYDFKITLDVDFCGTNYKIIRSYIPKNNKLSPQSASDYEFPKLAVVADGAPLPEKEQEKLLSKIMKKEVARFYLFDGELLDEYKNILSGKRVAGTSKIRKSIEDILGLPLLTNTRELLHIIYEEKSLALQEVTKNSKQCSKLGQMLESTRAEMKYYAEEMDKADKAYQSYSAKVDKLDQQLDQNRSDIENTGRKNELKQELKKLEAKKTDLSSQKSELLQDAWKTLIYPLMNEKNTSLSAKRDELQAKKSNIEQHEKLINRINESIDNKICDLCHQQINDEILEDLKKRLREVTDEIKDGENPEEIMAEYEKLSETLEKINSFKKDYDHALTPNIISTDNDIENTLSEIDATTIRLREIEDLLKDSDLSDAELKNLKKERDNTQTLRDKQLEAYYKNTDMYNKSRDEYEDTSKKIKLLGKSETEVEKASFNEKFVESLESLFETSIEIYRDEKRQQVEKSASELYCKLGASEYIGGLQITEDYSLHGINKEGTKLTDPSAGYSHLEAFALIGGLHKNVPIKGPLFLDTPSGRLDRANTSNLIQILPELSDQVILLIHDKEFDQKELHSRLTSANALVEEYTIQKRSENRSCLVKGGI